MPNYLTEGNRAWEAVLSAHAALMREFAAEAVWREHDVSMREYDVLYTLAKCPGGDAARIGELQEGVLLSQPALSRLIDRLASRGLVERTADPDDGRAVRVRLTDAGAELQRRVGRAHARSVGAALSRALSREEMASLERLAQKLVAGQQGSAL